MASVRGLTCSCRASVWGRPLPWWCRMPGALPRATRHSEHTVEWHPGSTGRSLGPWRPLSPGSHRCSLPGPLTPRIRLLLPAAPNSPRDLGTNMRHTFLPININLSLRYDKLLNIRKNYFKLLYKNLHLHVKLKLYFINKMGANYETNQYQLDYLYNKVLFAM